MSCLMHRRMQGKTQHSPADCRAQSNNSEISQQRWLCWQTSSICAQPDGRCCKREAFWIGANRICLTALEGAKHTKTKNLNNAADCIKNCQLWIDGEACDNKETTNQRRKCVPSTQSAKNSSKPFIAPLRAAKRQQTIRLHRQQNFWQASFKIKTNAVDGNA